MRRIDAEGGIVIKEGENRIEITTFVCSEGIRQSLLFIFVSITGIFITGSFHLLMFIVLVPPVLGYFLKYEIILNLTTNEFTKRLLLHKILLNNMFRIQIRSNTYLLFRFEKHIDSESNITSYSYSVLSDKNHFFMSFEGESTRNILVELLEKHVQIKFATDY